MGEQMIEMLQAKQDPAAELGSDTKEDQEEYEPTQTEKKGPQVTRLTAHTVQLITRLRRRGSFTLGAVMEEEVAMQKNKAVEAEAEKMRKMNFVSAGLTGLNLFFLIFSLWYFWDTSKREYDPASWGVSLRLCSSLVIVGQVVLLTTWHRKVLTQQELIWNLVPGTLSFGRNCGLWLSEICVLVLHYPPWIENFFDAIGSDRFINEKFALIGFLRLYLWFRILKDTDPAFIRRDEYEQTRECDDAGVLQYSFSFLLRSQLNRHPFASVLVSFGVTMFALSFSIWVLQREDNVEFTELGDVMWFTIVTMTTVGYGQNTTDINTGTKILSNVAAIVGILWWGVIIALVRWKLQLSRRQHHSLVWAKQEQVEDRLKNQAAMLIQRFWRFYAAEKEACGIKPQESWATKHPMEGFGQSPRGSPMRGSQALEKAELRLNSFQERLRAEISLEIYQMRCALYLRKQVEAEGRGDPMKQVFSRIEHLRESMTERREMFGLRMDQHVKLMRLRTKSLCDHLRDQHFRCVPPHVL
eukprot:TRINITY_DN15916_c0_g1_i2.p1 TRINITY_DN15916_c0_g1~~TRINITY_DN15916_c0_g1_i2.p1  ORF type:complete len:526 (-),score=171.54 TRINITY_DN15916_c0_g1_i2:261-1838(-)